MTEEKKPETEIKAEAGKKAPPVNKDPLACPTGFPKAKWDRKGDGFKRAYLKAIGGK